MKKKTIGIIQPHYLPWTGYFNLILKSDVFVYLDDVEFTRGEWKNRNKIRKNPLSEETKWISVPIEKKSHFSKMSSFKFQKYVRFSCFPAPENLKIGTDTCHEFQNFKFPDTKIRFVKRRSHISCIC